MSAIPLQTKIERAFIACRAGLPDTGNDLADALAFAGTLGQLGRLLDAAGKPLATITTDAGTTKATALAIIRTAASDKPGATKLLLESGKSAPARHWEVMDYLTTGLEKEITGTGEVEAKPVVNTNSVDTQADVWATVEKVVVGLLAPKAKKSRRKRQPRTVPITPRQTEAMHMVGEHKGNKVAAAKAMGISPPAVGKLYKKATAKIGEVQTARVQKETIKTRKLSTDNRGQETD